MRAGRDFRWRGGFNHMEMSEGVELVQQLVGECHKPKNNISPES